MTRLVDIIVLFIIVCSGESRFGTNIRFNPQGFDWRFVNPAINPNVNSRRIEDSSDEIENRVNYDRRFQDIIDEENRVKDTMELFNNLARNLVDAEYALHKYCSKNERAIEIYNTKEYLCTYPIKDYQISSIFIRIRHRVMRVVAISKPGIPRKVLDDIRILPDNLNTGNATYTVKNGNLTIHVPFEERQSNGCNRYRRGIHVVTNRRLFNSLVLATAVVDRVAVEMYTPEELRWQKTLLGHTFTMSRSCVGACESNTKAVVTAFRTWLSAHEEAQVMLASVLVVVGLWWLLRTVLALLINLVCPVLVVLLAVICVPQLRAPLLGQNYPLLANLLRNILLKMAESIKT